MNVDLDIEYENIPLISRAVVDGDTERLKLLILNGEDINESDANGNVPLHYAVIKHCVESLDVLLNQRQVKVDQKNEDCETPFLMSLKMFRSSPFIICLIKAGCDVNTQNDVQEIALHVAIMWGLNDIVYEMLERGADVDIRDECNQTALHSAVEVTNVEGACMLLCYGADVSFADHNDMTPLMYALREDETLAQILIDYSVDFSVVSVWGETPLLIAADAGSDVAIRLVKAGADVNCLNHGGISALQFALNYASNELFKLILPKIDSETLVATNFLFDYVDSCTFQASEWLECLYLLLDLPCAVSLTECCNICSSPCEAGFLDKLLFAFDELGINPKDRLQIIYLCLSLGAEVNLKTITFCYQLYGHSKELEALIYICDRSTEELPKYNFSLNFPLPTFILGVEKSCDPANIYELFKNQIMYSDFSSRESRQWIVECVFNSIKFFSFPYRIKKKLCDLCVEAFYYYSKDEILKQLEGVPEFPSLLELSRNEARKFVRLRYDVRKCYQFYDAVKELDLPAIVQDVILFKKPL